MNTSSKKQIERQQNKFGWSLEELEENARRNKSAKTLHEMAIECFKNAIICKYIAMNRYSSTDTLVFLANHPSAAVRKEVASRSDEIPCYDNIKELCESDFDSEEDYKKAKVYNSTLLKLALDTNKEVKKELSRTVKSEKIIMFLYKSNKSNNPSNKEIIGNCLRRSKNVDFIRKFIIDASYLNSGEKLFSYSEDILSNKYLTSLELLTFIIHCPKLSEKHVQMIRKSNGFNRLVEVLLKENCPAA